jgi:acetyltransferase-like isoleucine patch superfamily enzyme
VLVLRWFGAQIGTGTLIKHDVKIDWPWKLEIGNDTWIGESVWIINAEPVVIGSNTCISQAVVLCSGSHDIFSPTFEFDNAADCHRRFRVDRHAGDDTAWSPRRRRRDSRRHCVGYP